MGLAARGCWLFWGIGNPFNNEILLNLDIEHYGWNKHVKWGIATLFLMVRCYTSLKTTTTVENTCTIKGTLATDFISLFLFLLPIPHWFL
jgi:hypothetical protein